MSTIPSIRHPSGARESSVHAVDPSLWRTEDNAFAFPATLLIALERRDVDPCSSTSSLFRWSPLGEANKSDGGSWPQMRAVIKQLYLAASDEKRDRDVKIEPCEEERCHASHPAPGSPGRSGDLVARSNDVIHHGRARFHSLGFWIWESFFQSNTFTQMRVRRLVTRVFKKHIICGCQRETLLHPNGR